MPSSALIDGEVGLAENTLATEPSAIPWTSAAARATVTICGLPRFLGWSSEFHTVHAAALWRTATVMLWLCGALFIFVFVEFAFVVAKVIPPHDIHESRDSTMKAILEATLTSVMCIAYLFASGYLLIGSLTQPVLHLPDTVFVSTDLTVYLPSFS